ncbi:cardiomyopathy-associated protein 5-like [Schistocerca serialis cubense]|uniref:cardiomyopathy-associated protein 5-like n=1 Tax=Schistocerca serialis cubense TaxID=2023355 RepID=UPI00214E5E15|nr:cardiomyopathy-associated protein 5-like [Schistocerca serialis cubense]
MEVEELPAVAAYPGAVVLQAAGTSVMEPGVQPAVTSPEGQEEPMDVEQERCFAKKFPSLAQFLQQQQRQQAGVESSSEPMEEEQPLPGGSSKGAHAAGSRLLHAVKMRLVQSGRAPLERQASTPESCSSLASEEQEVTEDDASSRDMSVQEESSGDTRDVRGQLGELMLKPAALTVAVSVDEAMPEAMSPSASSDVWADSGHHRISTQHHRQRPSSIADVPSPARRILRLASDSDVDSPVTASPAQVPALAVEDSSSQDDSMAGSRAPSRGEGQSSEDMPSVTDSSQEASEGRSEMEEEEAAVASPFPDQAEGRAEDVGVSSGSVTAVFRATFAEASDKGIPAETPTDQQSQRKGSECPLWGEAAQVADQDKVAAATFAPTFLASVTSTAYGKVKQKLQHQEQEECRAEVTEQQVEVTVHREEVTEQQVEVTVHREEVTEQQVEVTVHREEVTEQQVEVTVHQEEVTEQQVEVTVHREEVTEQQVEVTVHREEVTEQQVEVTVHRAEVAEQQVEVTVHQAEVTVHRGDEECKAEVTVHRAEEECKAEVTMQRVEECRVEVTEQQVEQAGSTALMQDEKQHVAELEIEAPMEEVPSGAEEQQARKRKSTESPYKATPKKRGRK